VTRPLCTMVSSKSLDQGANAGGEQAFSPSHGSFPFAEARVQLPQVPGRGWGAGAGEYRKGALPCYSGVGRPPGGLKKIYCRKFSKRGTFARWI